LAAGESLPTALAISPDGLRAISGYLDGSLRIWELPKGELARTVPGLTLDELAVEITSAGKPVYPVWSAVRQPCVSAIAVMSDGDRAVSSSREGALSIWDISKGEVCRSLGNHDEGITAMALTPDDRYLLTGSTDRTLRLSRVEDGACLAIAPLDNAPTALALASNCHTVVVGDRVGNVHHFEIQFG
jgi:WD40 repeat protein